MNRRLLMGSALAFGAALAGSQLHAQERVPLMSVQAGEKPRATAPSLMRVPMEARIVKDAAYSAELVIETIQVLPDGNRIVRKTTGRVYRDSLGRTRREEDREPGRAGSVSVSDPVAGISFTLDPVSKVAWKTAFSTAGSILARTVPPPPPPAPADPADLERKRKVEGEIAHAPGRQVAPLVRPSKAGPAWEDKAETLGSRNIEGVMAEGTRISRTIPAGAIGNEQPIVTVTEEWRSADLQILVLTRTSDPRTGESTYKLLNIDRSEPNQSWFDVPADYTVRDSGIYKVEGVRK